MGMIRAEYLLARLRFYLLGNFKLNWRLKCSIATIVVFRSSTAFYKRRREAAELEKLAGDDVASSGKVGKN